MSNLKALPRPAIFFHAPWRLSGLDSAPPPRSHRLSASLRASGVRGCGRMIIGERDAEMSERARQICGQPVKRCSFGDGDPRGSFNRSVSRSARQRNGTIQRAVAAKSERDSHFSFLRAGALRQAVQQSLRRRARKCMDEIDPRLRVFYSGDFDGFFQDDARAGARAWPRYVRFKRNFAVAREREIRLTRLRRNIGPFLPRTAERE